MQIHLARTQGFCAGVSRAIEVVYKVLETYTPPIYVRHHIVHNTSIIKELEAHGVIFVEDLEEIPDGEVAILSAHGVSPRVYEEAENRHLKVIDATCPLVANIHKRAVSFSKENIQTVLIGHKNHQEVIGTSGYVKPELLSIVGKEEEAAALAIDAEKPIGYLTQTTLSVRDTQGIIEKLKKAYPKLISPTQETICFATQNRQNAVLELTEYCDIIIICGSPESSNSNRLKETASNQAVDSYIIDTEDELDLRWLEGKNKIGLSSGASTPWYIVEAVIEKINTKYPKATLHREESEEKNIKFKLPKII